MLALKYGKWAIFKRGAEWWVVTPQSQISIHFETWNEAMRFTLAYVDNKSSL